MPTPGLEAHLGDGSRSLRTCIYALLCAGHVWQQQSRPPEPWFGRREVVRGQGRRTGWGTRFCGLLSCSQRALAVEQGGSLPRPLCCFVCDGRVHDPLNSELARGFLRARQAPC